MDLRILEVIFLLLSCEGEVCEGTCDVTRIKSDEGELDALATYLEAVQVFLRQHIHSRNDICCSTSFHLHMRDRHLHAAPPRPRTR